jgi:hypothetical protein
MAMPAPTIITEVKRRLDGSEQRFACELVTRTPALVVACYRFEARAGFFAAHTGTVDSYGLFWAGRPYLCYYMVRPTDGALLAARFDVVRDVRLHANEVRYTDLLLDLWIEGGVAHWQDEDEVAEAERLRRLAPADGARITRTRDLLARDHNRVVAEARRTLVTAGIVLG